MNTIYHYLGIVAFWGLAFYTSVYSVCYLIDNAWKKYKKHLWVFHLYEWHWVRKYFRRNKRNGFAGYTWQDWEAIVFKKAMLEGRLKKESLNRKHHLFKKSILKMYNETLDSEAHKKLKQEHDSY